MFTVLKLISLFPVGLGIIMVYEVSKHWRGIRMWLGPWVSHPLVQSFTLPNKLWYSTLNASELGNYRARKGGREMEDREDITRVIS